MLSTWRLTPQLVLQMHMLPVISPRCGYHWGNYDASSGGCCKTQTGCVRETNCGLMRPIENRCNMRVDEATRLQEEYPKQLMEIIKRSQKDDDCELVKHDLCYYQPSDKNRRYQRTWSECPRIWLRPKPACCFDNEYCVPIERRPRPPPPQERTPAEMFAFQMEQICKYTDQMGSKPKLKCSLVRVPEDCVKKQAPFPSFSECKPKCIPQYCPTECACRVKPNLCEMWKLYHHNEGQVKSCTAASVSYCPFRNRARPM